MKKKKLVIVAAIVAATPFGLVIEAHIHPGASIPTITLPTPSIQVDTGPYAAYDECAYQAFLKDPGKPNHCPLP